MESPIVLKNNKNQQLVGMLHKPKKIKYRLLLFAMGFGQAKLALDSLNWGES